jgi:RimJ/RimL family protein N-acetyltransferase
LGYATEAAAKLVAYGFEVLGLNRIDATHLTRNPASGRVMEKIGMQYEGLHRQHVWKNGQFEDLRRYAILRNDQRPTDPFEGV